MQHGLAAMAREAGLEPGAELREQVEALEAERTADLLAGIEEAADGADGQFGLVPVAVERKRGGRQPGARNAVTRRSWEFLMATGRRDPLEAMMDVGSMSPAQVREAFKVKPKEAMDLLFKCWSECARYGHSPMPVQVNVRTIPVTPVTINLGWSGELPGPAIGGGSSEDMDQPLIPEISMRYEDGGWRPHNAGPHNANESHEVSDA